MFQEAEFLLSAASKEQFPELHLTEIAFAGRSNVGKSSLINHLTKNKKLARISATPGKTQLINFFPVDEAFCLVDLPGYGFAKVSKEKRATWGNLVQDYLEKRNTLTLLLLLVDLRHPPTEDDLQFARWAAHFNRPLVVVMTKADKLTKAKQKQMAEKHYPLLEKAIGGKPLPRILYSIKDARARMQLIHTISEYI